MFEIELIPSLAIFLVGIGVGVIATLIFNKVRTGSASAAQLKREMDDYQAQVEEHFEETSVKFKNMAEQYQEMYKHMAVGATTLCRSDSAIANLGGLRDPLANAPLIEPSKKPSDNKARRAGDGKTAKTNQQESIKDGREKADPHATHTAHSSKVAKEQDKRSTPKRPSESKNADASNSNEQKGSKKSEPNKAIELKK
jgi:uncharacterized membrane-anchored protein YhcB (DUF1043 family)